MGNLVGTESSNAQVIKEIQNKNDIEFLQTPYFLEKEDGNLSSNNQNAFSLLSYNVLADAYSSYFLGEVNKEYLDFSYRSPLIIEEIKQFSSDIICLQEVDNFETFYKSQLESLNYQLIYGQKTNGAPDGCLIGVRKEKFEILDHSILYFDKGHIYENQMTFRRGNLAIVAKLKQISSQNILYVICTHFYWDPKVEQVKYLQMSQILKYINQNLQQDDVIILAGDFNSMPHSNAIQYILNQTPPKKDNLEFPNENMLTTMNEIYGELNKLPNKMFWGNAYEIYGESLQAPTQRYPLYTNYTTNFKNTIDHILYSKNNLIPKTLLKIPTDPIKNINCLPNGRFPSDHLPIMGLFEILHKIKK